MDAVLNDLTVLQDHDPVQTCNGRKAVRNDDRSAVLHQILKSRLHQLVIGIGKLAGLTDQGAAEPVVVKGHGLVGQHVKTERGKIVVDQDLQLPETVVLQFAADLPEHVAQDQQKNVRPVTEVFLFFMGSILPQFFRQGKKYRKTRGSLPVNIAQNDFYRTAMASISTSAPFGRAAA